MKNRDVASFAAAVSSTLRRKGIQTLPSEASRMREGVRVSGHDRREAKIAVDLDSEAAAERLADEIHDILTGAGYSVRRSSGDTTLLYATREG